MSTSISRLKKIGFISTLPESANIDNFEVIIVKDKFGEKLRMYRKKKELLFQDDIEDFGKSWDTFRKSII